MPSTDAVYVGLVTITTDHLDVEMGLKCLGERFGRALGQEIDHPPPLEVDQDRPVAVALLYVPIVHSQHLYLLGAQARSAPDAFQQGVGTERPGGRPDQPLKLLKRQMYGRASFALLKDRMLHAA